MTQTYRLSNGIPVFIVESHSAPVVSIQAWVKRGSVHESVRLAGISHFLEHALFKGTTRRKVGEIASEIEGHGGEINAFTSFEQTAYYTTLASRYWEAGLDVIADALRNPLFDPGEMEREREVILEEIRRAHDSPGKMVSTNLWEACFFKTPYGRPVFGYEKTVRAISASVLRDYFRHNYHAGTLSVFIVGDIDTDKAIATVRKKFSQVRRGKSLPISTRILFPTLKSPRVVSVARDLQECHFQIGITSAEVTHPSTPAIDLACSALGQGESSRLYQRLVKETHLALDAHMALVATSRCGMATLAMATTPENFEPAVEEGMKLMREASESGLAEAEIERVKNSLESEVISGKETVDGYARRLGYYYCEFGDPDYDRKYLEQLLSVSAREATDQLHLLFQKRPVLSVAHPLSFNLDRKRLLASLSHRPARSGRKPEKPLPVLEKRDEIRFVGKRETHLPLVAIKLILPGGAATEPADKLGIANLFQRVWTSGTLSYTSLQMAHVLESLGASIQGFSGRNSIGLEAECLSKHWTILKPILREILTVPSFPSDEFQTEKELVLKEIASEKDSPVNTCHLNFLKAIYCDHPYGNSVLGTAETVGSITRDDLQAYFKSRIYRSELVISSVGNFPSEMWTGELAELCRDLPERGSASPKVDPVQAIVSPRVVVEKKEPLFQSHLMLGFLGTSLQDEDRYALKLLSACLAGQGGRLFLELRDRQSLAYSVAPIQWDGPVRGIFAFYIGCAPEKLTRAIMGIRNEMNRVLERPLPPSELKRAKEYWIGRFELDLQRYSAQSSLYGLDEFYGLGHKHYLEVPRLIKMVTSEDIRKSAIRYLSPDSPTFSIVHNQDVSEQEVLEAWKK